MPTPLPGEIHFETAPHVPPPYRHEYRLRAAPRADGLAVDYQLRYLDRDELTPDEILEEGFSTDDDFAWRGLLPAAWLEVWERRTRSVALRTPTEQDEMVLYLDLDSPADLHSAARTGVPRRTEEWLYLAQELWQGVLEAAGREAPLRVRYADVTQAAARELHVEASFLHRRLSVESGGKRRTLPWERLRPLLQTLYAPDYAFERATEKLPKQPGHYVDPGAGVWYSLNKALHPPEAAEALARQIEAFWNGS
ncbi:MAG: hypothetical protein WBA12_14890 [Catalinimonas sp.]